MHSMKKLIAAFISILVVLIIFSILLHIYLGPQSTLTIPGWHTTILTFNQIFTISIMCLMGSMLTVLIVYSFLSKRMK